MTETTADLTWALLTAVARRVVEADRWLRDGLWQSFHPNSMLGTDVFGKTTIVTAGRERASLEGLPKTAMAEAVQQVAMGLLSISCAWVDNPGGLLPNKIA
ncbi:MAG TPA: hypothetical protein VGO93_09645 [Candidatus Xenobia bacterium]